MQGVKWVTESLYELVQNEPIHWPESYLREYISYTMLIVIKCDKQLWSNVLLLLIIGKIVYWYFFLRKSPCFHIILNFGEFSLYFLFCFHDWRPRMFAWVSKHSLFWFNSTFSPGASWYFAPPLAISMSNQTT